MLRVFQVLGLMALLTGWMPTNSKQNATKKEPISASTIDLRSLPSSGAPYRVDPYIRMAVELQKMGSEEACKALFKAMTNRWDQQSWDHGFHAAVLCRMLFTNIWRPAAIGGPTYLPGGPWLSEPIEIVDGVPFCIVASYNVGGVPESGSDYLRYCLKTGGWNRTPFAVKTEIQKREALGKIMSFIEGKGPLITAIEAEFARENLTDQIK